jgi:hypothetical protein
MAISKEDYKLITTNLGRWGLEWQTYMLEFHKDEAEVMYLMGSWETVAKRVDKEAEQREEEIEELYEKNNPRPMTSNTLELMQWHTAKRLFVEKIVREQLIYINRWLED